MPIGPLEKTGNLVGCAWGPFGHMTMAGNFIGSVVSGLMVTLIGVHKFFQRFNFFSLKIQQNLKLSSRGEKLCSIYV